VPEAGEGVFAQAKRQARRRVPEGLAGPIYNKPHYRLTHLLEDGHLNRDGSRTEGKPHIEPAARAAEAILMKKVELTIGSAGRDD